MKLFLPGVGNKIEHIRCFKNVMQIEKIIISDIYDWTFGAEVADIAYILPTYKDTEKYLYKLEKIYEKEKFDICIPIDDYALYFFSKNKNKLSNCLMSKIAINNSEIVELVSDKLSIYRFLHNLKMPTPQTFTLKDFLAFGNYEYPYFLKPRYINMLRAANRGFYFQISSDLDLDYIARKVVNHEDSYVVQKLLTGKEYNIDLFCDSEGVLKSYVVLEKLEMGLNRGITRGEIVLEHPFHEYINIIVNSLKLYGANQIQAFITDTEKVVFTEINGRFSGSSVFVKAAGVDYFKAFIDLFSGKKVEINDKPSLLKMSTAQEHFYYNKSKYSLL